MHSTGPEARDTPRVFAQMYKTRVHVVAVQRATVKGKPIVGKFARLLFSVFEDFGEIEKKNSIL